MEPITYSGTWSGSIATDKAVIELDRFVAKDSGEHVVSAVMTSSDFGSLSFGIYITVNNEIVAQGQNFSDPTAGSIDTTWTGNLSPGDVVGFNWSADSEASSGTLNWNIEATPTSTDPGPDPEEPGDGSLPANAFSVEDIDMVYFGAEEAEALYRGSLLVWEAIVDLYPEANIWLPFRTSLTEVISPQPVAASLLGSGTTLDADAALFNGSGRIKLDPFTNFSQRYTVSMWVRLSSTGTAWRTIAQARSTTTDEWWVGATDNVNVGWRNNGGVVELWTSGQVINDGRWHHLAFTVERDPSNASRVDLRVWIDGVQRGHQASTTQPAAVSATLPIYIGGNADGASLAGWVDDFLVWDRALSPDEVQQVWSADIRSGAQIWMPLDPPGIPLLEHAGTLSPAVSASTLQARDGYAYTPSGTGPGATMHYAGTWDTGGTVSMWVRQTGQTTGAHAAFYRASGSHELGLWQQVGAASPYMLFSLIIGGVPIELHATGASVPNGQWAMVTVTVSRSSGSSSWTMTGYVNGEYAGQVTKTATAQAFAPGDISFAGTSWGGDVDDLLVWDRALSDTEVLKVYQEGRSLTPGILTEGLAELILDEYYYFTLDTNFSPDTWSATGLPAGITISNDGSLSGTPSIESSGTMTVTASGGGMTATKSFSWVVASNTLVPHSASNSGSLLLGNNVWGIIYSHTVQGNGDGYLFADWTFGSTAFHFGSHTDRARLRVNGEVVMSRSVSRQATSWSSSGSSPVMRFNAGDVVTLEGLVSVSNSNLRTVTAWRFFLYRS